MGAGKPQPAVMLPQRWISAGWTFLELVIIDLTSPEGGEPTGFRQLVEKLACTSHVLLLTCGNEGDAEQEVWARHLGVWMYLPGRDRRRRPVGTLQRSTRHCARLAAAKERVGHTSGARALYRTPGLTGRPG